MSLNTLIEPVSTGSLQVDWNERLGQQCLRILVHANEGAVLADFSKSERVPEPTRHSLQLTGTEHVLLTPSFLRYVNHSCAPNVFFDVERMVLVALRALPAGAELSFFYPSTEWTMSAPFECACDAVKCIRTVSGASTVSTDVLRRYRLAPHIRLAAGLDAKRESVAPA